MRVTISRCLLSVAGKSHWRQLVASLVLIELHEHLWEIDDEDSVRTSDWFEWLSTADPHIGELIQQSIRMSAYCSPGLSVIIAAESAGRECLCPADAVVALTHPVYVAVENSTTDGGFLRAVAVALSHSSGKSIAKALDSGRVAFLHLGGYGEVEKVTSQKRQAIPGPVRIFVLADSDALYAGHETATTRKVRQTCEELEVPYAILRKRKIENYLPNRILANITGRRSVFDAYKLLCEEQRSHYEMKNGFKSDDNGQASVPPEQDTLYSDVLPANRRLLIRGFGSSIANRFANDTLNCDDIAKTCVAYPDELNTILRQIELLL